MWKSNVKNIFFSYIFHVGLSEWSGTQVVAQSLKTRQQNGPKLEILQTAINTCLIIMIINILSLWLVWGKKNPSKKKLSHQPENDNSYLDTMTGTNSSNDRLISCYIASKCGNKFQWIFFMRRNFPGMKSSTTWLGNVIAQSPRKFRDISNTYNIRLIMVYRMIIDVILHLFIICYDLWCQLLFWKNLSVIMEALFSVRCLRCVVVARM